MKQLSSTTFAFGMPVLSGLLIGQLMLPNGCSPLAFVALLPLTWSICTKHDGPSLYVGAYAGGMNAHLLTFDILRTAMEGRLALYWCLVGLGFAFLWPLAILIGRLVHRSLNLPMAVLLPLIWLSLDHLRQLVIAGAATGETCSLAKLGLTQVGFLHLAQIADITGVDGVSWLIASANGFLADILITLRAAPGVRTKRYQPFASALFFLVPFTAALAYGQHQLRLLPVSHQPAVLIAPGHFSAQHSLLDSTLFQSLANEDGSKFDLVLFSEGALGRQELGDSNMQTQPGLSLKQLPKFAREVMADIIIGAIIREDGSGRQTNSLLHFSKLGELTGRYDKIHLAPGVEDPLVFTRFISSIDDRIETLDPDSFQFVTPQAGASLETFAMGRGRRTPAKTVGSSICFDLFFPAFFRRYVRESPEHKAPNLFVHCADESIAGQGRLSGLSLACARWRAIETRRPFVRSCSGGFSGVIDSSGRIVVLVDAPELFDGSTVAANVPLDDRSSFYLDHGDFVSKVGLCCLFAFVCLSLALHFLAQRQHWHRNFVVRDDRGS